MTTGIFKIRGMHCASCAGIIEKTLKKTDGVGSAEVNYANESAKLSFDGSKVSPGELSKKIEPFGYSLVVPEKNEADILSDEHAMHTGLGRTKKEKLAELAEMRKKLATALPSALLSIIIMSWDIFSGLGISPMMPESIGRAFDFILPLLATYILFVIGRPYLLGFYNFLKYGKANMDTLIGIGTSVAYMYSVAVIAFAGSLGRFVKTDNVYFDVTIIVITFIALGKYLEVRSRLRTGDAIEKLLNLQAKTAIVIRGGKEIEISVNEVVRGDFILVKPAGKIPVDGIITEGSSYVDESMITGEPMPVEKKESDKVAAGTMNTSGSFIFEATRVGSETMLAHIIKMVEEAQGSKAPIQALADKISSVFVPIVLVISLVSLAGWLIIGSRYMGFSEALSFGLLSFVSVLVIACPCALGLATPTAIIVGVGKGAKEGILIKDAATLEKLHKVNVIVMDKTGTITEGKPSLVSFRNFTDKKDEELLSVLASLESRSEHPLAAAIISYAKEKDLAIPPVTGFIAEKGKGIRGVIAGEEYFAGNPKLLSGHGISFDASSLEKETSEGRTPVIIAGRDKLLGVAMVADAVKSQVPEAIKNLHKLGLKIIMLTGDDGNTANNIAGQAGIDEVFAGALPEDKLNKIKELQSQGASVAMAGDGVNDAPALAQADVGIAMATGTDVAIESAGITLLNGDVTKLVKAFNLSKLTMRGIKQNLFWAFIYNLIGIPLAAGLFYPFTGLLLNPIFAGLAMAFSSVSVVGNSLRLKAKKL